MKDGLNGTRWPGIHRAVPLILFLAGLAGVGVLASHSRTAAPVPPASKPHAPRQPRPMPSPQGRSLPTIHPQEGVVESDEFSTPDRPARPGTERHYYERFMARTAADAEALDRDAVPILAGDGPTAEKAALLRALEDFKSPRLLEIISYAIWNLPDGSRPDGESVSGFALERLCILAASDPAARALLGRVVWEGMEKVTPARRQIAARALFQHVPLYELDSMLSRLYSERDADLVVAVVREVLSRRQDTGALMSIADHHPVDEIRTRVREALQEQEAPLSGDE